MKLCTKHGRIMYNMRGIQLYLLILSGLVCCMLEYTEAQCLAETKKLHASQLSNGTFKSPGFPGQYPMNSNCSWVIEAPEGFAVKLWFSKVDVTCDELAVYDDQQPTNGEAPAKPGCYFISSLYSLSNWIYISFRSFPTNNNNTGFQGIFTAVKPGSSCLSSNSQDANTNIVVRETSGIITTPGYPAGCPVVCCAWKFTAPAGHVLKFEFLNIHDRKDDPVTVCDGHLGRCGVRTILATRDPTKATVYSLGRRARVDFHSFSAMLDRCAGMRVRYSTVIKVSSGSCGVNSSGSINLAGDGGMITTEGPPYKYSDPPNMNCTWKIAVAQGSYVKVWFQRFWIGVNASIVIHDGPDLSSPILKQSSGIHSFGPPLYSSGRFLLIRFSQESNESVAGLLGYYEAVSATPLNISCEGVPPVYYRLTAPPPGGLASMNYPLNYPNDVRCTWYLNAKYPKVIRLDFKSLNMRASNSCNADSVAAHDYWGEFEPALLLGKFCGNTSTKPIYSTSWIMKVVFRSSSSGTWDYPGFEAIYRDVIDPAMGTCKYQFQDNFAQLNASQGSIYNPKYPRQYPPHMMCTWQLDAPPDQHVRLDFVDFVLPGDDPPTGNCTDETACIEVRDGPDKGSKLIGSYCGYRTPASIFSSGHALWARFKSKGAGYGSGTNRFNATYTRTSTLPLSIACGNQFDSYGTDFNNLTGTKGSFASQYYPNYYGSGHCQWLITTSSTKIIKLSFETFDLKPSSDCRYQANYVAVYDGSTTDDAVLGTFCGSSLPGTLRSSGKAMLVEFKGYTIDSVRPYKGFKASYEVTMATWLVVVIAVISSLAVVILAVIAIVYWRRSRGSSSRHSRLISDVVEEK